MIISFTSFKKPTEHFIRMLMKRLKPSTFRSINILKMSKMEKFVILDFFRVILRHSPNTNQPISLTKDKWISTAFFVEPFYLLPLETLRYRCRNDLARSC